MPPALLLLTALLAASPVHRGPKQQQNLVTRVEAASDGRAAVVTITATRPPNFTTDWRSSPSRFVIHLAEGAFGDVPSRIAVGDGIIDVIENAAVRSEGLPVARISILLAREAEPPDVEVVGTALRVRIERAPGGPASVAMNAERLPQRPAVARGEPGSAPAPARADGRGAAGAAPDVAREAGERARAEQEAREKAAAEARAKAEALARLKAEAAVRARAEVERRRAEQARREVEERARA